MATKVPALKNVPVKIDRELRDTLESMREAQEIRLGRRGDPLDRAITLRELIDSGMAKKLTNRPFDPNGIPDFIPGDDEPGDLNIPPAPTGLEASGAFTEIIIDWNPAQYSNHAYTEVWRSRDDEIGTAILITTTSSFIVTDSVGYDQTYFYWVRFVSTSNVKGPFNQTNGTKAETVENIGAVMQQLSEELQDLPGFQTLNSDLSDITSDISDLQQDLLDEAAAASRVIKSTSAPTTRSDSSSLQPGDIWIDTDDNNQMYVRNASNNGWTKARDSSLISLYNTLSSTVSTNSTNIATAQSDIVTLTTDTSSNATAITNLQSSLSTTNSNVSANSSSISSLTTQVQGNDSDISSLSSSLTSLTTTVNTINGDYATGTALNALTSRVTTNEGDITSINSSLTSLTTTVNTINGDYATGTALTALTSRVSTNEGSITSINSSITSLQSQITANDGDITGNATAISGLDTRVTSAEGSITSQASSITQLQTDVGSNSASVTSLQTSVTNLEGDAQAAYVLQVQANGSVAGMVIEANASGATTGTAVQFVADKFAIWNGSTGTAPFIVSGGTVYIDSARIQDGAITNARIANATIEGAKIADAAIVTAKIADANITTAKIANLAVTNAKINNLSATKITSDQLDSARINVDTLNVKHFDNVSTDIKAHTGAFVPLQVFGSSFQRGSTNFTVQTQTTGTYLSTTIGNVRNNAKYQAIWTGVYGDCTNGVLEYSVNGSTYVQAAGGIQNVTMAAGTFRTYVFAYSGTITGLSSTSTTVYWRVRWLTKLRSTYQSLYVFIDNTQ